MNNPLTEDKLKRIGEIAGETLKIFGKNYLNATKKVIKEAKEKEVAEKERLKAIEAEKISKQKKYWDKTHQGEDFPGMPDGEPKNDEPYQKIEDYQVSLFTMGLKARRPRPVRPPGFSPTLQVSVTRFHLMDTDTDPYCIYYVQSVLGNKEVGLYHRYSDFKNLNKTLKKILPKEAKLPEKSSMWGSRNLTPIFLLERVKNLGIYLDILANDKEVSKDENFLKFLGLNEPENPLDMPIFDMALRQTKWDIHSWGELIYNSPEEGMSRLIQGKVHREMWSEIASGLPTNDFARKKMTVIVYKTINTTIDKLVPPAWKTAYETSKPIRDTVQKALGNVIGKLLEEKTKLVGKIDEGMAKAFLQVRDAMSGALKPLFSAIIPLILQSFGPLIKLFTETIEPSIYKAMDGEEAELNSIANVFNKTRDEIKSKLQEKLDEAVKAKCDGIKIDVEALMELFTPIRAVSRLINALIGVIDPIKWSVVLESLIKKRNTLKSNGPLAGNQLKNTLDEIEDRIEYDVWLSGLFIGWAASSARYDLWYCGVELGDIPDVVYETGYLIKKKLHREVLMKFVNKFTDYVWIGTIDPKMNNESWGNKVDNALKFAYNSAKKKFLKNIGIIIKDFVKEALEKAVLGKVVEFISKALDTIITPLEEAIPDPLKDLLEIKEILKNCVINNLRNCVQGVIDDQEKLFVDEYNKQKQ